MSVAYQTNFLAHMSAVADCLPKYGAQAEFDIPSFRLRVSARGRYYDLTPQYVVFQDGRSGHTTRRNRDTLRFQGWLPYSHKRWELSTDKATFKRYCLAHGLRVPRRFARADDVNTDVLIKRVVSSFGEGIRGPFRPNDVAVARGILGETEYYDEFIRGDIAKIWYWEDRPTAVEIKPMPTVVGDGETSLKRLIQLAIRSAMTLQWSDMEIIANYQDLSLDGIVPAGKNVLVDFRYGSALNTVPLSNQNVLEKLRGTPIGEQLDKAGVILWRGIPEDIRPRTLFTLDAIIDSEQQVWFLEMNSNPVVYPDVYMTMFESLFRIPTAEEAARAPRGAAVAL